MNLLTVDWDYFFPVPEVGTSHESFMYDWSMAESPMLISMIWPTRAHAFFHSNMELPRANDEWRTFWDRFHIRDDATLFYGDSHMYAWSEEIIGITDDAEAIESIWLYDAHHDSGYMEGSTYKDWVKRGRVSCEDWMVAHYHHGTTDLHVRYPAWKPWAMEAEQHPLIPVDRQVDDGTSPLVEFDCVYVCRSSAWVPPWEDANFDEFLTLCPGYETWEIQELPERTFDEAKERAFAAKIKSLTSQLEV